MNCDTVRAGVATGSPGQPATRSWDAGHRRGREIPPWWREPGRERNRGGFVDFPLLAASASFPHERGAVSAEEDVRDRLSLILVAFLVLLALFVGRAAVTYDTSLKYFGRKAFVSGNPVRREFLEVDDDPSHDAAINAAQVRVLVFGGSQGAHAINVAMVEAAPKLAAAAEALDLVCQTGARDFEMVRTAFERHRVQGRVERFIDAMDREMKAAGLVVSRAGATTLAEVTAAGRPAILIPLPTATDDHQRHNARVLERAGAAELMEQSVLTGERLAARIIALAGDRGLRRRMSAAARQLAKPRAAEEIVDEVIEEVAKRRGASGPRKRSDRSGAGGPRDQK